MRKHRRQIRKKNNFNKKVKKQKSGKCLKNVDINICKEI